VLDLGRDTATVRAKRTLVPKGREKAKEQEQELTVHLVKQDGWKVADLLTEGQSVHARMHRLLVEPEEAEGISVRAWARTEPDGKLWIAVNVRNGSSRRWRLKCAGFAWRKGRVWRLSEATWRTLRRGGAVDYEPGAEHGIMLVGPVKAERLWLRATPRHGLRSFFFALSWEPVRVAAPAEVPPSFRRRAGLIIASAIPVAAIGVFVSLVKSVPAAVLVTSFMALLPFVEHHRAVWQLERKLARFRAESLANAPAAGIRRFP
jgi:hypothetical protein